MRLLDWNGLRAKGHKKSKAQTYRDIAAGIFPRPVYPGRSPAWPEHEIDAYFERLIAERDSKKEVA